MKIFISYAREDFQTASEIYAVLDMAGYDPFLDKEKLDAGRDFPSKLETEILESDGFIFLMTPDSLRSEWVRKELDIAIKKRGNLDGYILPVQDKNKEIQEDLIPEKIKSSGWLESERNLSEQVLEAALALWPNIYHYKSYKRNTDRRSRRNNNKKLSTCPYHNLSHFGPEDEKFFFGRDSFVAEQFNNITNNNQHVTVISGASGSGKSSVVLAGIVPYLHSATQDKKCKWLFTYFRPSKNPFLEIALALSFFSSKYKDKAKELASELENGNKKLSCVLKDIEDQTSKTNKKLLIILDQFGQLFSPDIKEEICRKFLECLFEGVKSIEDSSPLFWIVTVEAINLANPMFESCTEIHSFFEKNKITLYPMNDDALKKVIRIPAEVQFVDINSDLVDKLINEVKKRANPESIALLEFILWRLWEEQTEIQKKTEEQAKKQIQNEITLSAYSRIGGINALTEHAEEKFRGLTDEEKKSAIKIFLRLVFMSDSTGIMPRIATKTELEKHWTVVEKLAGPDYRLIVTSRSNDTVEVIHEALIREWDSISKWLKDNEEGIELVNKIEVSAKKWNNGSGGLFYGEELKKALAFQEKEDSLSEIAERFLEKSNRNQQSKFIMKIVIAMIIVFLGYKFLNELSLKEQVEKRLSSGERLFVETHYFKRFAVKKFSESKKKSDDKTGYINTLYESLFSKDEKGEKGETKLKNEAKDLFEKSLALIPDDPETLIYLNNTKVIDSNPLIIAVSVPIEKNPTVAQEILRGVAQAQKEVNDKWFECEKSTKLGCFNVLRSPMLIKIASDGNDPDTAEKIARYLIKHDEKTLAVVGHNASNVSNHLIDIYQQNHLVMISPTSFAINFSKVEGTKRDGRNYIYTVAFDIKSLISGLTDHILKSAGQSGESVLLCYDSEAHDQDYFINGLYKLVQSPIKCDFSFPESDILDKAAYAKNTNTEKLTSLILAPHVNKINDAINMAKENASGPKLKLFASPTLYNNDTLLQGKEDVNDLILAVYWHPTSHKNGKNPSFYDKAVDIWKKSDGITWRTALAYDAMQVIINGLKEIPTHEPPTSKKLQEKIANPKSEVLGATGKIEFNKENGQRLGKSVHLVKINKKGENYVFEPIDIPSKTLPRIKPLIKNFRG